MSAGDLPVRDFSSAMEQRLGLTVGSASCFEVSNGSFRWVLDPWKLRGTSRGFNEACGDAARAMRMEDDLNDPSELLERQVSLAVSRSITRGGLRRHIVSNAKRLMREIEISVGPDGTVSIESDWAVNFDTMLMLSEVFGTSRIDVEEEFVDGCDTCGYGEGVERTFIIHDVDYPKLFGVKR